MTRKENSSSPSIGVKLSIWSIRNQAWLSGQVRIYIFTATAIIAYLTFADVISYQTAVLSSVGVGLIAMGLIWTLIQQRKALLLRIESPEIRAKVHQAMLAYLRQVDPEQSGRVGIRDVRAKHEGGCRECGLPSK